MPSFDVLGQGVPGAGTLAAPVTIATVEGTGGDVVTYISIANKSPTVADIASIAIVPDGETLSDKHFQDFFIDIPARASFKHSISMPVGVNGTIRVGSQNGSLSVTVGGMEYAS